MCVYQLPTEPPIDDWNDRDKSKFIEMKIEEICHSIYRRGENGRFPEVFDYLYQYIEDNIEKFLGE